MSYDAIGNLTSYNGNSYTWEGRQLRTITGNEENISFKYNSSGIRTEKTVDGKVTKYHLVGDRVTYEETKDSSGNVINKIYYIYSSTGKLVAMNLDGAQYNYIRNAQGDIIGLLDSTGAEVVSYTYDSWGKLEAIGGTKASTVGIANPYRYRGYMYDTETGLYYLQSRYYNPEWGRFINSDALAGQIGELLSHNVFMYCKNNPINMSDDSGFRPAFDSEKEENGYYDWKEKKHTSSSNKHRTTIRTTPSRGNRLYDPNTDGGFGGNIVHGGESGCPSSIGVGNPVETLGRGSTGRTIPNNLNEQISMHSIMSNPLENATEVPLKNGMTDPRWFGSDGWTKMQRIFNYTNGKTIIHFVYNVITGEFDDFKFK